VDPQRVGDDLSSGPGQFRHTIQKYTAVICGCQVSVSGPSVLDWR
jgi:hypothetical protein